MSELTDIAATFGTSEPVFRLRASASELNFDLVKTYVPEENGDPVHDLLVGMYGETLNREQRRFEGSANTERAYAEIISTVRQIFLKVSPLKNPKQSKLHRWLQEQDRYNHSSGFIALYRYIKNNDLENARCENPHAKNVVAILELMKEKYEVNNKASSN